MIRAAVRRWRDLPFAHKLALVLIALVSMPIIIVVAYTTYTSRDALVVATRARNLERARGTAEIIDAFLADARADVRTVSRMSTVVSLCENPRDQEAGAQALKSLRALRDEQRFIALYVTDEAGRVLVATDDRVQPGALLMGRVFLGAMAGETVIDEPTYDEYDKMAAITVAHAVRSNEGEIIGTAIGLISVEALDTLTAHDRNYAGHGEFSILFTASGLRVSDTSGVAPRFSALAPLAPESAVLAAERLGPAYPDDQQIDPGFAELVERGAWLLYDIGTDPHLRIDSQRFGPLQGTVVPLRSQRWVYGIFVPESQLLASLAGQTFRDWAVAFFTVLAVLILSLVAARWVTQPLRRIMDAAESLARGDMASRAKLQHHDEFGQLGRAFDAMADALSDKERQLQQHAADLERRVEERTATLQLLERAGRSLASSLEIQRTAENLTALLVPATADFCAVDVRDQHGAVRRMACRHADPDVGGRLGELRAGRIVRDASLTLSGEERAALGITDVRFYELSAGRQFVGYLTVAMAASGRRFDEGTDRVLEELGRRAGLALANALLYQEAQDANRLKDEFLGVVSHELRTPLNAILGWARLAGLSREAGIDGRKALDAVDRNARALARLVDDLLDVPRIVTGKLALDLRPTDLVAIVNAAVDAIRPSAVAKGLTVSLNSELASATLHADPQRLQQVFGNLLANAVKFTPRGGRVSVAVARGAETYTVTVEDNGAGITPDFLPFVFDRFRQADSSPSRAHGGLGIGLSIVRHLVEMHGGRVFAESDGVDRGSRFTVQLPVAYFHVEDLDEPVSSPRAETRLSDQLRGLRLIVMDDDADAREVAARLLESVGADVATTSSVAETLTTLARAPGRFDAVLADIGMPGEDGYAFIAGLRSAPDARVRDLAAVAVTAYASPADRSRALAAGFDAHVAKPVAEAALVEALTQSLAQRSHK